MGFQKIPVLTYTNRGSLFVISNCGSLDGYFSANNNTRYTNLGMTITADAVEGNVDDDCLGVNGSVAKIWCVVETAGANGTFSLRSGAADVMSLNITSGTTGYYEATGSAAITEDGQLNWKLVSSGAGIVAVRCAGIIYVIGGV